MHAVPLLAFLLLAAAPERSWAAPGKSGPREEASPGLAGLTVVLQGARRELEPRLAGLEGLAGRYPTGDGFRALERERGPLRAETERLLAVLQGPYEKYKTLCDQVQLRAGATFMSAVLGKRASAPGNLCPECRECLVFRGRIHDLKDRGAKALEDEQKAYHEASEAFSARRRGLATAAALAVLLAAAGVLAAKRGRERVHTPEIVE